MKICCFILLAFMHHQLSAQTLQEELAQIVKKHHFNEKNLGFYVASDSGEEYLNINGDKKVVPASLTKIISAAAVLRNFPLNQRFKTELFSKGKSENGQFEGELCLKGGGDPSFVSEKMWFLVNEFTRQNIKQIEGTLVIDSTRFDDEIFDRGRDSHRVDRAYDAPISAVSFNWNAVNIFVKPTEIGKAPQVVLDPENQLVDLRNKAVTKGKLGKGIEVSRFNENGRDVVEVRGFIGAEEKEIVIYKNVSDPSLWVAEHLKQFLKQRGISFKGKVVKGTCSAESKSVAAVEGKQIYEMVADMLKYSNNFVAEMLVKNLGADKVKQPASMEDGLEFLKNYLDSIGIKRGSYVLKNVSGLTRENEFAPKQLFQVLESVKSDFMLMPEFLSGLPIAGLDGTLKNRFKGNDVSAFVRAKTGYLDGVVGLAGYVRRKNNSPLSFVFIFNGGVEKGLQSRALFDDLVLHLVEKLN